MRCAWECLDVWEGDLRGEGNVAVINYRYDGDKTPPAHLGYDVPYVSQDRKITAFMRDAKLIRFLFNAVRRPLMQVWVDGDGMR